MFYIENSLIEMRISMKPFIKWAGGKGQLIGELEKRFPVGFGENIKKYAEPFVGGGALLFHVLGKYKLDEVYISDTNAELINVYKTIRNDVYSLIKILENYQTEWSTLSEEDRKNVYYTRRDKYNQKKESKILDEEMAALFIFLNRTCFNGLYRVNSKGQFNVPCGHYSNPTICNKDNLLEISNHLNNVQIICGDYKVSENFVDKNTFVYFDPPYRPLSETSSFTSYVEGEFNDKEQIELSEYIRKLAQKGCFVLASNSDPKNTCSKDNFFDDLYKGFDIRRVEANRNINSKSSGRGKITEILVSTY